MRKPTPNMSNHKALSSALATAMMTVVLMMVGVIPVDELEFATEANRIFTILAAILAQAGAAGLTAYFKRNYLK